MMYADLVDLDDFITVISEQGVPCDQSDTEGVKFCIRNWLREVSADQVCDLRGRLRKLEEDAILLPEVEDLVLWCYQFPVAGNPVAGSPVAGSPVAGELPV